MAAVDINVGDKYATFADVQNLMNAYEKLLCVNYYISDSRKLESAAKNAPKIVLKAHKDLVYYYILFTCIHGGRKFKSKSSGARPNQSTFKQECLAKIRFVLSEDGQHLVVKEVNGTHNHHVSKTTFDHLPRQRKLDEDSVKEATMLLGLKANKKMVQEHLQNKTGKVVLLRDLSNIRATNRSRPNNELEAAVQLLQQNDGEVVVVASTEDGSLVGIFYQDRAMQQCFAEFPELLLIDATYKLNDLRMPLYVLMIVDSNGESEIVGTFLAADETHETISVMIQAFKNNNPAWQRVCAIMSDKDFVERAVMREEFPQAALLICLFHVLRTFRREVTCERMGIRSAQRDMCLDILQQIVYSKSPEEYEQKVAMLQATGLESVVTYFNNNWHPIREEFVEGFKSRNLTLGNRTNNRLESINEKIKSVCSKNNSLSMFYKELLLVLHSLRVERDHRAILVMQKRPVSIFPAGSTEARYLEVLTPFAFALVKPQIESYHTVRVLQVVSDTACEIECGTGVIVATIDVCPCLFRSSTGLPCKHILTVRGQKSLHLFDINLVPHRWTRNYYLGRQQALRVDQGMAQQPEAATATVQRPKVLTAHQKYRMASIIATELASLVSEAPMRHFEHRIQQMRTLCDAWKGDRQILVQVLGDERVVDENAGLSDGDVGDLLNDEDDIEANVMATGEHDVDARRDVTGWNEAIALPNLLQENDYDNSVNHAMSENDVGHFSRKADMNHAVSNHDVEDVVSEKSHVNAAVLEDVNIVCGNADENDGVLNDNLLLNRNVINNAVSKGGVNVSRVEHTVIIGDMAVQDDSNNIMATGSNVNQTIADNGHVEWQNIRLPPKMNKRGRPKGAEKTVVGLPRKRAAFNKVRPFNRISVSDKERAILSWLLNAESVDLVLLGDQLVNEAQVEVRPEKLPCALLDDNVELKLVQRFFTHDGWLALNRAVRNLRKHVTYYCSVCHVDIGDAQSIVCDCCLVWSHMTCAGLNKPPKMRHWFCKACTAKA